MIEPRTGRVTAMGQFLPSLNTGEPRTARYCQRAECGTRLRHGNPGPLCAPCDAIMNPWQPPPMRTRTKDECPTCGGLKMRASKLCRNCREKHLPRGIKSAA